MKKLSLFGLIALGLLSSCKKEEKNIHTQTISIDKVYNVESNLKRAFGKALLASMQESPLLRNLLKNEALKQFDNDYEVLYYLIKDASLENGHTVQDLLIKNLDGNLDEILLANPTLTILIPELPENSFSAMKWDAAQVIPAVAVNTGFYNDIPIIMTNGQEEVIPANKIPGFPVIVIKNNERLVSNVKNADFDQYETRIVYNEGGVKLRFWADGFDRSLNTASRGTNTLDQKLIDAYNIYKNADGWQRDYIYYNIQPSSPNGGFQNSYKEYLTSFQVGGIGTTTAQAAYQKISDQVGDPSLSNIATSSQNQSSHWTGGNYEFRVKCRVNSKDGGPDDFIAGFSLAPYELFTLTFTQSGSYYIPNQINSKLASISVPLFKWKLENYTPTVLVSIEEVDNTETITQTESRTSTYAGNFNISGEIFKIGLKFGGSAQISNTKTATTSYTVGSDDLYSALTYFSDNIIIGENKYTNPKDFRFPKWQTLQYSTGYCSFSMEPVKYQ